MEKPENIEHIKRMLTQLTLSAEDRLLLALTYDDGLSSRKVAELINSNASEVQRRLKNIRRKLLGLLSQFGVDNALFVDDLNGATGG